LTLWRLAPSRGAGHAELYATYLHPGAHGVGCEVHLLRERNTESLDQHARALATALHLPLRILDGDDD
jgi:hypothetical protein